MHPPWSMLGTASGCLAAHCWRTTGQTAHWWQRTTPHWKMMAPAGVGGIPSCGPPAAASGRRQSQLTAAGAESCPFTAAGGSGCLGQSCSSGGGNGFELLTMPPPPPSPPPAGPSLPPGPTPLLLLGSCGSNSSGRIAAATPAKPVHVGLDQANSSTALLPSELFSLYHLGSGPTGGDLGTRLVDPGDQVLLKSGGQSWQAGHLAAAVRRSGGQGSHCRLQGGTTVVQPIRRSHSQLALHPHCRSRNQHVLPPGAASRHGFHRRAVRPRAGCRRLCAPLHRQGIGLAKRHPAGDHRPQLHACHNESDCGQRWRRRRWRRRGHWMHGLQLRQLHWECVWREQRCDIPSSGAAATAATCGASHTSERPHRALWQLQCHRWGIVCRVQADTGTSLQCQLCCQPTTFLMALLNTCNLSVRAGAYSTHLFVDASKVVRVGSSPPSTPPQPAEAFSMYRPDGAPGLIQPGDRIRLISLFTRGYCRLGVLPATPGLTGLFCDAPAAGAAVTLVYTGRGLSLTTGEVLSATGIGCALVVSNTSDSNSTGPGTGSTGGGGGGGSGCIGASCSGVESDLGYRTFGSPPPPAPSSPPLLPGGRAGCAIQRRQPALLHLRSHVARLACASPMPHADTACQLLQARATSSRRTTTQAAYVCPT